MNLSSQSDSDDENFDGHYKKVNYLGNFSDSEHSHNEDSPSQDSKQRAGASSRSPADKSKAIMKNCESAKLSRQRKKVYLELLEQRANELKAGIFARKTSIAAISAKVLQKFSRSNREKHAFLIKKIALSKKLLAMNEQIVSARKALEETGPGNGETAHAELEKNLSPETLVSMQSALGLKQEPRGRGRRRRGEEPRPLGSRREIEQRLSQKEESLQLGINAFLYEFGVRGSLRMDVLERSKAEWFQQLGRWGLQCEGTVRRMRELLGEVEEKSKKLDYYLRELKGRVRERFVLQFLLDREFFMHNCADTIYRRTPMAE